MDMSQRNLVYGQGSFFCTKKKGFILAKIQHTKKKKKKEK